jgi:hypothetical protein
MQPTRIFRLTKISGLENVVHKDVIPWGKSRMNIRCVQIHGGLGLRDSTNGKQFYMMLSWYACGRKNFSHTLCSIYRITSDLPDESQASRPSYHHLRLGPSIAIWRPQCFSMNAVTSSHSQVPASVSPLPYLGSTLGIVQFRLREMNVQSSWTRRGGVAGISKTDAEVGLPVSAAKPGPVRWYAIMPCQCQPAP